MASLTCHLGPEVEGLVRAAAILQQHGFYAWVVGDAYASILGSKLIITAVHVAVADSQLVNAFECLLQNNFISVDDDSDLSNDEWLHPHSAPFSPDRMPAAEWPAYHLRLPGCWSRLLLDPTSAWNLDTSDQPLRSSMFKCTSPILEGILPDLRIYTAAMADRIVACWLDANLDKKMTFFWESHFMQLTVVLRNLEIHDWLPEDAFLLDIFALSFPRYALPLIAQFRQAIRAKKISFIAAKQTLLGEEGMEAVERGIRGPLFKVAWRKYCLRVPIAQRLPPPLSTADRSITSNDALSEVSHQAMRFD